MKIEDAVAELVAGHVAKVDAAIEVACEAAVQGGVCGVLVIRDPDGSVEVSVNPRVPYGYRYEVAREDW